MTDWTRFPHIRITSKDEFWRIHDCGNHPAYFTGSDRYRFGPPPSHRGRFGTCYLGFNDARPAYVEKYGRDGVMISDLRSRYKISQLLLLEPVNIADLTERSVLGRFGINASYSTGGDYGPSQMLAANLFDAGFGGIRYRISHDPKMELEAVALFGEPGEHPEKFVEPVNTLEIPDYLVEQCREFGIHPVISTPSDW